MSRSYWQKAKDRFDKSAARLNTPSMISQLLLIIGAQKSGTTALFHYLDRNPKIVGSFIKEPGFFSKTALYEKGKSWYVKQFPPFTRSKVHLEATPGYMYLENTAANIRSMFPEAKLVAVLREPVGRAYSAWNMYNQLLKAPKSVERLRSFYIRYGDHHEARIMDDLISYGKELPGFIETIKEELEYPGKNPDTIGASILRRGLYAQQLAAFYNLFPSDQIRVYSSNTLMEQPGGIVNELESWVGVPVRNYSSSDFPPYHKRSYPKELGAEEVDIVSNYYEDPNRALFKLLGRKLSWSNRVTH